jgi:hypothetical protein
MSVELYRLVVTKEDGTLVDSTSFIVSSGERFINVRVAAKEDAGADVVISVNDGVVSELI